MEQDIEDLATAVEAIATALLIMERFPDRAGPLIRQAQAMAAEIRQERSADDALTSDWDHDTDAGMYRHITGTYEESEA